MLLPVIFLVAIFVLAFMYLRGLYNQHYWQKRGVVFYKKHKTGGPFWQFAIENRSFFQIFKDIYDQNKNAPAVGLGALFNKALYVKDPVNMQHIFQVDFQSFYHRGVPITDEDILANNILLLNGPQWKLIRQKLTPLFTAAKLKSMYYIIDKSARDFVDFLKQNPEKLKGDAYDTITHFSTAALAGAVFGIGTESTFESPFRIMARDALLPTTAFNMKFIIGGLSDELYKALNLKLFTEYEEFFIGAIKQVIQQREKENIPRHDFIDLCVNLQKNGTLQDPETGFTLEPTAEMLAAQAFFFFLAGVEPSSAAIFGVMMELGRHPEILKRVHEEVDAVFEKYNDQLTYDAINEVEYLDNVLSETLRVHTPIGFLSRQCMKNTVLPVGNIPIDKGVKIFMPIFELHHDPKYFPNPETFDPDRFSRDGEISDLTYIPFGKGSRFCIGARYARVQLLSGLMHFLRHYTLNTNIRKGGIKYNKEQNQVRITNVDIEFISRVD